MPGAAICAAPAAIAMGPLAIVNPVAIWLLGRWVFAVLRDFQRQADAGQASVFVAAADRPGPRR